MTIQAYLQIENNVVTNIVMWDGDVNTWQPPADATMLIQATTPAMVWVLGPDKQNYVLSEVIGAGQIGFTWDGSVVITNEPQPKPIKQPISTGTQTA